MHKSNLKPYVVCDVVEGDKGRYFPILIECRLERDARYFGRPEQLTAGKAHFPSYELFEEHRLGDKIARVVVARSNHRSLLERLQMLRNGRGRITDCVVGSAWNVIRKG